MILLVLAFLGGVLTIISPCILPVLPFQSSASQFPSPNRALLSATQLAIIASAKRRPKRKKKTCRSWKKVTRSFCSP